MQILKLKLNFATSKSPARSFTRMQLIPMSHNYYETERSRIINLIQP